MDGAPAPLATGTLETKPFTHLLAYARNQRLSGALVFRSPDDRHAEVVFWRGRILRARLIPHDYRFGALAAEKGHLDRGDLEALVAEAKTREIPLGELLVQRGSMSVADRDRLLTDQINLRVQRVFSFPKPSNFAFYGATASTEEPSFLVDPIAVLWRGICEARPESLSSVLDAVGDRALQMVNESPLHLAGLTDDEMLICTTLVKRPRTLAQLRLSTSVTSERIDRLAFMLLIAKCVEMVDRPSSSALPVVRPSSGAMQAVRPSPSHNGVPLRPSAQQLPIVRPTNAGMAAVRPPVATPPPNSMRLTTPGVPIEPVRLGTTTTPPAPLSPNRTSDAFATSPPSSQARPGSVPGSSPRPASVPGSSPMPPSTRPVSTPGSQPRPGSVPGSQPRPGSVPGSQSRPGSVGSFGSQRAMPAASISGSMSAVSASMPPSGQMPAKFLGPVELGSVGIEARAKEVEYDDPFKILQIPDGAPIDAARAAYMRLAKLWHPDRLPTELAQHKPAVTKVFSHINTAHQTLTDPSAREAYLANRSEKKVQRPRKLVLADIDVLLEKRQFIAAEDEARRFLEENDKDADGLALFAAATTRACEAPDGILKAALAKLDEALMYDGSCVRAYFHRGVIYKHLGNGNAAYRDFARACHYDPKHVDAAREVRLAEMRARKGSGERALAAIKAKFKK